MKPMIRIMAVAALALATAGCASLLGGGQKVPPTLLTLTPTAPAPSAVNRSAAPGEAITVEVPSIPRELRAVRVPAQASPTQVAYITNLQWVDTPDRLFRNLLSETIVRTTGRVVLGPLQTSLDPGLRLSGQLHRFGYDAATGSALVVYDAALSTGGGTRVETRRFTASASADGTARTVGSALNQAANQVARDVAQWVGG